jgi:hypothetical protein
VSAFTLFDQAFSGIREPRSNAYKEGVMSLLRALADVQANVEELQEDGKYRAVEDAKSRVVAA